MYHRKLLLILIATLCNFIHRRNHSHSIVISTTGKYWLIAFVAIVTLYDFIESLKIILKE